MSNAASIAHSSRIVGTSRALWAQVLKSHRRRCLSLTFCRVLRKDAVAQPFTKLLPPYEYNIISIFTYVIALYYTHFVALQSSTAKTTKQQRANVRSTLERISRTCNTGPTQHCRCPRNETEIDTNIVQAHWLTYRMFKIGWFQEPEGLKNHEAKISTTYDTFIFLLLL